MQEYPAERYWRIGPCAKVKATAPDLQEPESRLHCPDAPGSTHIGSACEAVMAPRIALPFRTIRVSSNYVPRALSWVNYSIGAPAMNYRSIHTSIKSVKQKHSQASQPRQDGAFKCTPRQRRPCGMGEFRFVSRRWCKQEGWRDSDQLPCKNTAKLAELKLVVSP